MSVTRTWNGCKGGNSIRTLHYPWLSTQSHGTQDSNTTPKLLETPYMTHMTMTFLHQDVCIQSTKNDNLHCHWCLVIWGKRVNSDDWVDLWPRGSNRTGMDWFFQPGPGVHSRFLFRLDPGVRCFFKWNVAVNMQKVGECVWQGWLGFVGAGSCRDDTWDWIKSAIEWDMNARLDRIR